jgi:chemotaxis protein methyltransferase CheR
MEENNVIDEKEFQIFKKWIYDNLHFDSSNYNDSYIKRRIQSRMFFNQINVNNFKDYKTIVETKLKERQELLKNLTVNVTRFMRNLSLWIELERKILPEIINRKKNEPIKIWSAGCSSGEEPYSLAILLNEILKENINKYNIKIYATDIDNEAINLAKNGEYNSTTINELKSTIVKKYFTKKDNLFLLNDNIKKMITFQNLDLFQNKFIENNDLIICRNVVIYFKKESKELLYEKFYKSLNNKGYFIMGQTEMLSGPARNLFKSILIDEKIYQKDEN